MMDPRQHFEKYSSKLRFEAILKSLFCGLSVGFSASFVVALAFWFTDVNGLWFAIGALVGVTAIAAVIFYRKKFHPTVISNARRLDSIGLDERLVTMVDYRNDTSYIAELQRQDATAALAKVQKQDVKFFFPTRIFVSLAICASLGIAMSTLGFLGFKELLPGGDELIDNIIPEEQEQYVSVTYIVEEGGYIEGEMDQLVLFGTSAEPVMAVAEDGYVFVEWDDGVSKPSRADKKVEKEIIVTAIFELVDGEGDGDQGDDGAPGDEGDEGEQPGENGQPGESGDNGEKSENNDSNTGGGKYESFNQVIDGKTYYREVLSEYKEMLEEYLENNSDSLTEEQKAIIKAYIGIV